MLHPLLHPFKMLKAFLPKTLLARSLIILIAPVLLIQGVMAYVFIDRHLAKVTELLTQNIAGGVSATMNLLTARERSFERTSFPGSEPSLAPFVQKYFHLTMVARPLSESWIFRASPTGEVNWVEGAALPVGTFLERYLARHLQQKIEQPCRVFVGDPLTQIYLYTPTQEVIFTFETKRLFSKTTEILFWWALGTPILFLFIAILFLRNQVRPLRRLSEAVAAFGKGQGEDMLHPSGAQEIRQVTEAFEEMRARIRRQIEQRTLMLAGVSHDLRTPLARMSLQLAVMGENPDTKALQEDLREMEEMLSTYLAFARGEGEEATQYISLHHLVGEVLRGGDPKKVSCILPDADVTFKGRRNALKRCLSNLVENGRRYAPHVWFQAQVTETEILCVLDDDGPGIPPHQQEEVFKPFIRLEASRNTATGGTGLGLSIARDIARAHGGDISLGPSSKGGVRVVLTLPL